MSAKREKWESTEDDVGGYSFATRQTQRPAVGNFDDRKGFPLGRRVQPERFKFTFARLQCWLANRKIKPTAIFGIISTSASPNGREQEGLMADAFDDRETAAVGLCLRLIDSMRSRHRAGIMDAASRAELWLERNYGASQRAAAAAALKRRG